MSFRHEYDLEKTGIWGEAVRQRKPVMVNVFAETNPLKKGDPNGHVPLPRFPTIPIIDQRKITAVVGVANKETDYEDSDVVQLSLLITNIFGLFNKLDASSEGSGLGLALVKRIVEVYGGRIWVESDGERCESCFRFTLPRAVKCEVRKWRSVVITELVGTQFAFQDIVEYHTREP